jgi:hypothetical protein
LGVDFGKKFELAFSVLEDFAIKRGEENIILNLNGGEDVAVDFEDFLGAGQREHLKGDYGNDLLNK